MVKRGFFKNLSQGVLQELHRRKYEPVSVLYEWLQGQPEFDELGGVTEQGLQYFIYGLRRKEKQAKAESEIGERVVRGDGVRDEDYEILESLNRLLRNTVEASLEHSEAVLDSLDKTAILKKTHIEVVDLAIGARNRYIAGMREVLKDKQLEEVKPRSFARTAIWKKIKSLPQETIGEILDVSRKTSSPSRLKVILEEDFGVVASLEACGEWIEKVNRQTEVSAALNHRFRQYEGIDFDGAMKFCVGTLSEIAQRLEGEGTMESAKMLVTVTKELRQLGAGYIERANKRERAESESLGAMKMLYAITPMLQEYGAAGAEIEALMKACVRDFGKVEGLPPRET